MEAEGRKILFDTGADGNILLFNMEKLKVDLYSVDEVFISHHHWDHTGGLERILAIRPLRVYIPDSCHRPANAFEVIRVNGKIRLGDNIFSTGELCGIEQSLVLALKKGTLVITGCSHPGIATILSAAREFGRPYGIVGGLHDFDNFSLLEPLPLICPAHCTRYATTIRSLYPEKYVEGGVGREIIV